MKGPVIAIHGGAGAISKHEISSELEKQYRDSLRDIIEAGADALSKGASALDSVALAVSMFEDNPLFNAGRGSVFTHEGKHELDASIMCGRTLNCGAVAGLTNIKNPIYAARCVMEKSKHVLMISEGAEDFLKSQGFETVPNCYFSTDIRLKQLQKLIEAGGDDVLLDHDSGQKNPPIDESKKMGTVGAVALDSYGNLAAATSTGGMTNKMPGRVGDSPIIGAGCYANNQTCAVSTTGHGEHFIRSVVAYDISALMQYKGLSLVEACNEVVHKKLPSIDGSGGLIAVDRNGNASLPFNSSGMYRALGYANGTREVGIYASDSI
ncbi:isoaspartyl peptidase/L-asparaginase family protein [Taylorella equigenitalis]|uniref:L-asparaginase n=1 Tax=Taylorella equigenitalis ATCC 35865 TaxID=743973 RepID=A0ABM5NC14_9BURK|nr:isoaspartyl peptidase/L-asparaginase [Taylorella equigenitalis]AFN36421.1 L-asparaginase [Taylorella equigenitalis ATCC 35865]ASY39822.1 isoaspartyl peptidase/L-asparaginase [Taylorella equigenitalis]VEG32408.1 Isoaspartyl peptidase precursor [Taylorella equigenitalis ATCC 35865]